MDSLQQILDTAWTFVTNNYLPFVSAIVILVLGRIAVGFVVRRR